MNQQITTLLSGLSTKQKISILAAALLTVAAVLAFTRWRHEGDFRPLYTSMAPEDAAGVVQKLRESGVEYRLSENGGSVLVPSAKLAESRLALAAAGLPKTGRIGFELFDKTNFGATEFVEHINYKRALEGELERSVMSLAEVEQARVHLTMPKDSIFIERQQPAKASVMLKLKPGARISPQNVVAVSHLVGSAVEGLTPDAVSVLDMNGALLSRPKRAGADTSQVTSEALEMRQQIERDLVAKINQTLTPLLGADKFRAGASVDYDLTSGEQQEETFDPARSVMVTSQKTEDVSEHAAAAGVPGTASNLPRPTSQPSAASGGLSRRTENVTYQSSRVVRQTKIPQGIVKRMSLSVLLDQVVRWEGEGSSRHRVLAPPAPETLKTIRDLIAGATGFDAQRGDQLIVESLPFESTLNAEPPPMNAPGNVSQPKRSDPVGLEQLKKHPYWLLLVAVGLGVLVVVIGILARRLKRRKSAFSVEVAGALASPAVDAAEISNDAKSGLSTRIQQGAETVPEQAALRVREIAQRDLAVSANILRMWLQERQDVSKRSIA